MAKKTRTIVALSEDYEKQIYDLCDEYGIKDKNIATKVIDDRIFIDIYCGYKKFDQIRFKLGGLCKCWM